MIRPFALWTARALPIVLLVAPMASCIEDPFEVLPTDANDKWLRSVTIDVSRCLNKSGSYGLCGDTAVRDMQRVRHLSGVIGAPTSLLVSDTPSDAKAHISFGELTALWARIPVGYGCEATLQGIFPDRDKDPENIQNYNFAAFEKVVGAVRTRNAAPIWTAAYALGDGEGTCNYAKHGMTQGAEPVAEQSGAPIGTNDNDLKVWAKVVRRVVEWYGIEFKEKMTKAGSCSPPAGTPLSWYCSSAILNIEYGRDPSGAGGYTEETKQWWLKGYKAFAGEIRGRFAYPAASGSPVLLFAPSVVVRGKVTIENTTGTGRSWLYDFIDYVKNEKLPLSFLTVEIEAATPVEAADIAKAIRAYADQKGLKNEDGDPIPLFVTDLRLQESKVPVSLRNDPVRMSAYRGAFFAATKALWQGVVWGATVGRAVRFPTADLKQLTIDQAATTALQSDLMWFEADLGTSGKPAPSPASLKPAAWHSFWFYDGFLGGGGGSLDTLCGKKADCNDIAAEAQAKSIVLSGHGPDALGLSGTVKSDPVRGLIVIATREKCVSYLADSLGVPVDCVTGDHAKAFPAVSANRKSVIRVFLADLNVTEDSKETLKHNIRVEVQGLPSDVRSVGFRWGRMDGATPTWNSHDFPDQGLLDVKDGAFHINRTLAVPSMQYFEFLY